MKTKIIIALVVIPGILGLVGCKPKPVTAAGQVFIVTQGGDNVKLGDIEILLIEKAQVMDFLAKTEPAIDAEITSRQQEYESLQQEYKVADEDYKKADAVAEAYNPFESEEVRSHAVEGLDRATAEAIEQKALTRLEVAEDNRNAARKRLNSSWKAENYFTDFSPTAAQKTFSDADGKFSFVYSRNSSLTIYASAQRTILNGPEKYYWLIDTPTNAETVQVFLSNNNLVSVDPDDYFKLKPK